MSIWFDVPSDISAKDVDVNCLPRFLTISVKKRKYQRRLTGVCVPSELVWEFDDDLPQRRLRVEVAMRDLRSWEDGPFLPEMSRKEAQRRVGARGGDRPPRRAGRNRDDGTVVWFATKCAAPCLVLQAAAWCAAERAAHRGSADLPLIESDLDLEEEAAVRRNPPGREAALAVALLGRDVELADLADGRA